MAQDTAGNLRFDAGDNVVFKYDGKRFTRDSSLSGLAGTGIFCMMGDTKGNTWFGTGKGLFKHELAKDGRPEKLISYTSGQGLVNNGINCIKEDRLGNLWLGTDSGASKFDGDHFINYTTAQGLIRNSISSIEEDRAGNIWLGTDSGASKFDGHLFTSFTTRQGLIFNAIRVIRADEEGLLWFGTRMGISKYQLSESDGSGVFTNYTKMQGLSDNSILNITEDQSGNMWFGTVTGGICKYNRNQLTKYTKAHGLAGNMVRSIIQDKAGYLWFGTEGGASRYDGKMFSNYSKLQGLPDNDVFCMLQDKQGNLWLGGSGTVSKFDGNRFTIYTAAQGLQDANIWSMVEDREGNLWFSSWQGVSRFDGKSITRYTTAQGLVSNEILSIIQDHSGNMWFSASGVSRFDGHKFTNYTYKDALPVEEIPGMMADASGNIWFGTYGKGLLKFRDDSVVKINTTDGIADNTIFAMKEDSARHRIWFGTNSGLSDYYQNSKSGLNKDSSYFENFNFKTGYEIKDFSFSFSLCIDNKGVVWGGTGDRKLIRFDYDHLKKNSKPFRLELLNVAINNENICWSLLQKDKNDSLTRLNEMISTFGKELSVQEMKDMHEKYNELEFDSIRRFYPIPQDLVLPYKMHNIGFDFAAIEPALASQIKYQYQLEGYDKEWSPLSNKSNATFGNIGEGTYTFRVKALSPYGVWSEASYQFKVLPPMYRTWWAYLIYTLAFLTLLRVFSKWRERNLRSKNEKLEIKVTQRTNELKNMLENLKSTQAQLVQSEKMASLGELTAGIAHEIQNPLNFVNNFSEVSNELIVELKEEKIKPQERRNEELENDILNDLQQNLEKINHHGKRADAIVKGMLQHSQKSAGQKESTDINDLCDEYLRLAYHSLKAKDNALNITLKTDFDEAIGKINVSPQEIGRTLLNLYNNAFYAVKEKAKSGELLSAPGGFEPEVSVTTKVNGNRVIITVKDNGNGIPSNILNKIFQPFFTTKPTGQGTGLGLSLSYDIVKAHGGEIKVNTKENEGTEFVIELASK
jgi:signal transduction histidine kinase/ligand-binding sensor domain-containing protein